jgi:hypothetical protein
MRSSFYINTTTFPSPDKYRLGIQTRAIKYFFLNKLLVAMKKVTARTRLRRNLATKIELQEMKIYSVLCEISFFCRDVDKFFTLPGCYASYVDSCLEGSSGET